MNLRELNVTSNVRAHARKSRLPLDSKLLEQVKADTAATANVPGSLPRLMILFRERVPRAGIINTDRRLK